MCLQIIYKLNMNIVHEFLTIGGTNLPYFRSIPSKILLIKWKVGKACKSVCKLFFRSIYPHRSPHRKPPCLQQLHISMATCDFHLDKSGMKNTIYSFDTLIHGKKWTRLKIYWKKPAHITTKGTQILSYHQLEHYIHSILFGSTKQ